MMKLQKILILACAICLANSPLSAQKDVSAVISAANDRWEAAFNDSNAEALANLYTENGRLLPPNFQVIEGREGIEKFWGQVVAPGVTCELTTISAMAYGKTAIEEGVGKIFAEGNVVDDVKYILEWKKVDGEWQIHKDMWSSNNPPPQQ